MRAFSLLVFLLVGAGTSNAFDLTDTMDGQLVGEYTQYFLDDTALLPFEKLPSTSQPVWQPAKKSVLSFGYNPASVWVHLPLENSSDTADWFLEIAYPVLDDVDVHIANAKGEKQLFKLGDHEYYHHRPVNHRNFVVPLKLERGESADIFVRVASGTSLQVPIRLWRQKAFYDAQQFSLITQGIYFGFMLVMVLYNLFLYSYIREIRYLLYVMFVSSFTLFQASISGFGYQFLWPQSPVWNEHTLPIFLGLVLLTESIFIRAFLQLKDKAPLIAKFLLFTAFIAGCIILASFGITYRLSIVSLIVLALPINIICLVMGLKQSLEGDRAAQFFTVAWFSTLTGAVFLALNKLGVIERNVITENALQIGTAIEVVLLSFALGEYIAQQRRDRQRAKQEAYDYAVSLAKEREDKLAAQEETIRMERVAREAQERAYKTQQQVNETLEKQVSERTHQLEETMRELEQANQKLQHISNLDELTGIYNRRYFNQRFETEFKRARRLQTPLSVIIADVDFFKAVNDNYGHLVGDACLKIVAQTIKNTVTRPLDILARYGGEEFIVLLPDTPVRGSKHVAERLREAVESTQVSYEDLEFKVTISIGISCSTPTGDDVPEALVNEADRALYRAKEAGRNRVMLSPDCL